MKRLVTAAFIIALAASVASAVSFPVTGSDLVSSRKTPTSNGLIGHGSWTSGGSDGGIKLSWNISFDSSENVWEYSYTFTECNGNSLKSDVCHMLLEVSSSITKDNYCTVFSDANSQISAPKTWSASSSNPSLPSSFNNINAVELYGASGDNYTFESTHAPMWGSFYAVDGACTTYVWNSGIGTYPTSNNGSFTAWIPVPDTTTGGPGGGSVPEPATMALLGLGLAGLLARRKIAKA